MLFGYARSRGLAKKLHDLKPDIVYSVLTLGWNPLVALICKYLVGYKLFIGSHTAASVFPLARKSNSWWVLVKNFLSRWVSGRLVSLAAEKCYCPTHDCGEVAVQFFGVQLHKISIIHLGIDTEFFFPIADSLEASRQRLRQQLGFTNDEIVCIYTGKMSIFKNPLVLAQAIESLRSEGRPFRAIFIGDGSQRAAVAQASPDSALVDFMEFNKLGDYYRAADIAVWPTNESTSMLDAAACGLPLVVSDQIYQDHVQGNGMAYRMNDLESLVTVLRGLQDETVRRRLGAAGALKMRNSFTWESAARRRLRDFESSLNTPT
jgi:glycosyltransferase involved in cell wall biosynthesis